MKGQEIARAGQVRRIDETTYMVHSQFGDWEYQVVQTELGWTCACPDCVYRQTKCKHIFGVEFSRMIREEVRREVVIEPVSVYECLFCHSKNLKRFGIRHNQCGDIQRFLCADCTRTFSINIGFEKMKHNPKAITSAMQLYFNGESLRNVADSLRLLGGQVSHMTVYNWIRKYVGLMQSYADKITPQVGETWRTDELFLKVKGDLKYLFAMMDDETRFWIAQQVADNKGTSDVRPMFRDAIQKAGKKPKTLISDGASNFHDAFRKEMWSQFGEERSPDHVRDIRLGGEIHNNKMERMNGEIRDREKVMRGLKRSDTPILKGVQIFHNYIRPHEGLDGRTPAEVAGIVVKGEDKWKTLIQNASRNQVARAYQGSDPVES